MANNEIVLDLLEDGEYERAKHVVAWYIWAAKAYGVKAVNPGGVAAWKWGKDAKQLSDPIEGYKKLTPGTIITQLGPDRRRTRSCRIRCICTATTSARRATSRRRSRR